MDVHTEILAFSHRNPCIFPELQRPDRSFRPCTSAATYTRCPRDICPHNFLFWLIPGSRDEDSGGKIQQLKRNICIMTMEQPSGVATSALWAHIRTAGAIASAYASNSICYFMNPTTKLTRSAQQASVSIRQYMMFLEEAWRGATSESQMDRYQHMHDFKEAQKEHKEGHGLTKESHIYTHTHTHARTHARTHV